MKKTNDAEFLNLSRLENQPLRFAYGLSLSHAKDGNRLLATLGRIFEQEYLVRQKKLAILDKARERPTVDFRDFSIEDLAEARKVFWCLNETFKKHGCKASARLFKKI